MAHNTTFRAHWAHTLHFLMVAQRTVMRFSNNLTMPHKFKDTDTEHVESMLSLVNAFMPNMINSVKPMIILHDASEIYDEPKTVNGILFNTLTPNQVPQFEKMAFEAAATWAAICAVQAKSENDYLKIMDQDKEKISVFKKDAPQQEYNAPLIEVMGDILLNVQNKKSALVTGEKKIVTAIVDKAQKIYTNYTDPQKRQTDPLVTGVKLLDKWSGLEQLNACATGLALNMPNAPFYWANKKQTTRKIQEYWDCIPLAFTPSAEIIADVKNLAYKNSLFVKAINTQCPEYKELAQQANEKTKQLGADYLRLQRPYYSFNAPEPNWQSAALQHRKQYNAYLKNNLVGDVVSAELMAQAFYNGVDISDFEAIKTSKLCLAY